MRQVRRFYPIFTLLLTLMLLSSSPLPVYAATFEVNNTGDGNDVITGNGICATSGGVCTLRAAVQEANGNLGTDDIITFADSITTINIGSNITINSNVTINGGGDVTVNNTGSGRIFLVDSGVVVIDALTITGGSGTASGTGLFIQNAGTNVTLQNGTKVIGNAANNSGGGITLQSNASLTITGSGTEVSGNTAPDQGAGIRVSDSTLIISNGASVSNHTGTITSGAGIYATNSSSVTIDNATVSGNTNATNGGGIFLNVGATLTLQNGAVISGNSATGNGGGIYQSSTGNITISDSRIESNTATTGDAIHVNSSGTGSTITHSCITNNGDTAISNFSSNLITASGGGNIAQSNWWGTTWGPRIPGAGGGSGISNGDSISGNGTNLGSNRVNVGLTSAGTDSSAPTGAWLSSPPTIGGVTCQTCTAVSSVGHSRMCS